MNAISICVFLVVILLVKLLNYFFLRCTPFFFWNTLPEKFFFGTNFHLIVEWLTFNLSSVIPFLHYWLPLFGFRPSVLLDKLTSLTISQFSSNFNKKLIIY